MGFIVNPYRYAGFSGTLLLDNFTDTDGTALASHTPDINFTGDVWTLTNSSDLVVDTNQIKPSGDNVQYAIDLGVTDFTLNFRYNIGNSNAVSYCILATRGTGAINSGWRFQSFKNQVVKLYENTTLRASGSTTITTLDQHDVEMILSGTSIKIYLDTVLEIDHTITTTESYGTHFGPQMSNATFPSKLDYVQVDV